MPLENFFFKREVRSPTEDDFASKIKASELYTRFNLVDDAFLNAHLSRKTKSFILYVAQSIKESPENRDTWIIDQAVLTAQAFQEKAKKKPQRIDPKVLVNMLTPTKDFRIGMEHLVKAQFLTSNTIFRKFLKYNNFYNAACHQNNFDFEFLVNSGIIKVEDILEKTDGFDSPEFEALQSDILGESHRSKEYPLNKKAHPLVLKLRGQENTEKMSRQIEEVRGLGGTVMEDLDRVFQFYLKKTTLYSEIQKRDLIKRSERLKQRSNNIKIVNERQKTLLKKDNTDLYQGYDPKKRHFDIYARYGQNRAGSMDPLQLAFIAKSAEWYIMGERSLLFNSVRIIPYKDARDDKRVIPKTAHLACKGSEILMARDSDFRDSHLGANRTYLTHSDSREANTYYSIPIIGLATASNADKHAESNDEYVVFNADFDPKDRYRSRYDSNENSGVNGDIAGLINESLRTMLAVEKKEIELAEKFIEEQEKEAKKNDDEKKT